MHAFIVRPLSESHFTEVAKDVHKSNAVPHYDAELDSPCHSI